MNDNNNVNPDSSPHASEKLTLSQKDSFFPVWSYSIQSAEPNVLNSLQMHIVI